jgi:hypothetical protein
VPYPFDPGEVFCPALGDVPVNEILASRDFLLVSCLRTGENPVEIFVGNNNDTVIVSDHNVSG